MKRAQLIGITIAGGAGLLAFILMRSIVSGPSAPTQIAVPVNATEVLVARRDIPLGEITKDTDFRWQTWPTDAITPSFITQAEGDEGMKIGHRRDRARSPARGRAGNPPEADQARAGRRAGGDPAERHARHLYAIKEETSAGRLILPNDRVDVILTRRVQRPGRTGRIRQRHPVLQRSRPRRWAGDRHQGRQQVVGGRRQHGDARADPADRQSCWRAPTRRARSACRCAASPTATRRGRAPPRPRTMSAAASCAYFATACPSRAYGVN